MPTISLPKITSKVYIGFIGDSPVTLGDLGLMIGYTPSSLQYLFPVASRGYHNPAIHIHDNVYMTKDGWVGHETQPNTDGKVINKLAFQFFNKEVWATAKQQYSEKDKWKVFGYFMTDYMINQFGRKIWNNQCCVYWCNVAETLKV